MRNRAPLFDAVLRDSLDEGVGRAPRAFRAGLGLGARGTWLTRLFASLELERIIDAPQSQP